MNTSSTPTPKFAQLEGQIASWLANQREAVWRAAQANGVPPTVSVPVSTVEFDPEEGSHWQGRAATRSVNPLMVHDRDQIAPEDRPSLDDAVPIGDAIVDNFGDDVRFWSGFGHSVIAKQLSDPSLVLADGEPTLLVYPLHLLKRSRGYYCSMVPSLDSDDETLAAQTAKELLEFVEGSVHQILTTIPVGNILLPESPVRHGALTFRSMTPEEAAARRPHFSTRHDKLPAFRFRPTPDISIDERAVLELRNEVPKGNAPQSEERGRRLLLAFALVGYRFTGAGQSMMWEEPESIGFGGRLSSPLDLPSTVKASPTEIDESALREVLDLHRRLPEEDAVTRPVHHEDVALRRFMLGTARSSPAEAIVDYATALEGVLLPPSKDPRELRFRLALNGAVYLADDPKKRHSIRRSLTSLYDLRSRLVHGGARHPSHEELASAAEDAHGLARTALRQAVENGWPTQNDFYRLLFGEGDD